jgi:hypothetical protein
MTFTNGYATIGNISSSNQAENDDYVLRDTISWAFLKSHTLRFGGEYRAVQHNDNNPIQPTSTHGFHARIKRDRTPIGAWKRASVVRSSGIVL